MKHIRQTTRTTCGQTCLSMIVSELLHGGKELVTPERIMRTMKKGSHGGKTNWKELRQVLDKFMLPNGPMIRVKNEHVEFGEYSILRVTWCKSQSHYVVMTPRGIIHDPLEHAGIPISEWLTSIHHKGGHITSQLQVYR
jgi:hypothetical protein